MGQTVFKALKLPEERDGELIQFVVSTPTRDRYGDVVAPDWKLENYRANPVVFYNHSAHSVIGRAHDVRLDKDRRLLADLEFLPRGMSAEADLVQDLIRAKFLHATSIGFLPEKQSAMRDDDGGLTGFRYTGNELLEISVVGIPANPEALAFVKGLNVSDAAASRVFRGESPALFLAQKRRHIQLLREAIAR